MKVPLIIKFPESRYAGTENYELVSNIDLTDSLLIQLIGAKFLSADMPFQTGWE